MSTERYTVAFCDILLVQCVNIRLWVGNRLLLCTITYCFCVVLFLFCFDLQRTFSELSDPADLHRKCQELCQSLAEDMQKERVQVC